MGRVLAEVFAEGFGSICECAFCTLVTHVFDGLFGLHMLRCMPRHTSRITNCTKSIHIITNHDIAPVPKSCTCTSKLESHTYDVQSWAVPCSDTCVSCCLATTLYVWLKQSLTLFALLFSFKILAGVWYVMLVVCV